MLKFISGSSEKTWIAFSALEHTSRAFRKKDGEIVTETVKGSSPLVTWRDRNPTVFEIFVSVFLWISLIILPLLKGYKINPMIKSHEISSIYYLISAIALSIGTVLNIINIKIVDSSKSMIKNHGAEHKVLTAYRKLKRIPTIDEAQRFSRIYAQCGVTVFSSLITGQLLGFFIYQVVGIMLPEKLIFFIPLLLCFTFPFNLLSKLAQFFTTKEPDDENVELAIAALTELVKAEDPAYNFTKTVKDTFKSHE